MTPELKPCPFCGNHLQVYTNNVAYCKTKGCMIEHLAVDLDVPRHVAAWNTRADTAMVAALIDQNSLLRSAQAIANREGVNGEKESTNWDAFYNRVAVSLKRHHQTVNAARAAMKEGDA